MSIVTTRPIWPTLGALDACWASDLGQRIERQKAAQTTKMVQGHIPGRPKVLMVGPASDVFIQAILLFSPAMVFQAYPSAIGMREGDIPALMIDTGLLPFQRGYFDLVILSHVLEYQPSPLEVMLQVYEVLQPQGRLLTVVPHPMTTAALRPGYGGGFFNWQVRTLLRQSAFDVRRARLVRQRGGRPACLCHLAQPQVPPRPRGRVSILPRLEAFWRTRRTPGIAASGQSGVGLPS